MRRLAILGFLVALAVTAAGSLAAQEIVDRIVARVENDIILWSDIRALSRYQQFVDGKSETDAQILDRLIDQWMVRTEADVSHFPHPSDADIERSLSRLQSSYLGGTIRNKEKAKRPERFGSAGNREFAIVLERLSRFAVSSGGADRSQGD